MVQFNKNITFYERMKRRETGCLGVGRWGWEPGCASPPVLLGPVEARQSAGVSACNVEPLLHNFPEPLCSTM